MKPKSPDNRTDNYFGFCILGTVFLDGKRCADFGLEMYMQEKSVGLFHSRSAVGGDVDMLDLSPKALSPKALSPSMIPSSLRAFTSSLFQFSF